MNANWRYVCAVSTIVLGVIACHSDDTDPCPDEPISVTLKPIYYWGTTDGSIWKFNTGNPIASGRFTQWLDETTLISATGRYVNGVVTRGILDMSTASIASTAVTAWTLFAFDKEIWFARAFRASGEIWVSYFDSETAAIPRLSRVTLQDGVAQIEETPFDESWQVGGLVEWNASGDLVIYATRPSDAKNGFFLITRASQFADSLLFETTLSPASARGFDVTADRKTLLWGDAIEVSDSANTVVNALGLDSLPSPPRVVAQRPGIPISIAASPANNSEVLLNRRVLSSSGDEEDAIDLLNIQAMTVRSLDVRTGQDACDTPPRNEFPMWRPDGEAFVFRSLSNAGYSEVWLKDSISRP